MNKKDKIGKTLPKLEIRLLNRITVWELLNSKSFMYSDFTYDRVQKWLYRIVTFRVVLTLSFNEEPF